MLLLTKDRHGRKRRNDMAGCLTGKTAFLVGGAPSLREQPVHLLEQRGVVTMAMNNAGKHFRPTYMVSGDNPQCFEPRLLMDATITKFAPISYIDEKILGTKYHQMPNCYFYIQEPNIPWDTYLDARHGVPWYNNTLFVSIHILYQLGVRRIILAGSDFGFSKSGEMYIHATQLGDLEKKWNMDLYNSLVREIRLLAPVFERYGLQLLDSSLNSRISQTYQHITLEEGVRLCLEGFPEKDVDTKLLPHCSKFASKKIQDSIANWPGYSELDHPGRLEHPRVVKPEEVLI